MIAKGFTESSMLTMYDGSLKQICRAKKRDIILTASNTPAVVSGVNKFRYVGNVKLIHAKGNPEPLEAHILQKIFALNSKSWKASRNKWLYPAASAGISAINTLDFRHEVRMHPCVSYNIDTGDRLSRVVYPLHKNSHSLLDNEGMPFLLGLFAARGQTRDDSVILNMKADEVYSLARVEALLKSLALEYKLRKDDKLDSIELRIQSEWLVRWLLMHVVGQDMSRSLSSSILMMGADKQIEFLSGYFGDNNKFHRAERSLNLVMQIQMMLDRNRIHATSHRGYRISTKDGIKKNTYNTRVKPFYTQKTTSAAYINSEDDEKRKRHNFCHFIGNKVFIPVGKTYVVEFDGFLYYLELNDADSYIINGVAVSA